MLSHLFDQNIIDKIDDAKFRMWATLMVGQSKTQVPTQEYETCALSALPFSSFFHNCMILGPQYSRHSKSVTSSSGRESGRHILPDDENYPPKAVCSGRCRVEPTTSAL